MNRLLLLYALSLLLGLKASAQTLLFSENFESNPTFYSSNHLNQFIVNECVGNGSSLLGTKAAYLAPVLSDAGNCAAYSSTFNGLHYNTTQGLVTIDLNIELGCAQNLSLSFDYKKMGVNLTSIYYRIMNTGGWIPITTFNNSANWTTTTIALPAELNNQFFELRFAVETTSYFADEQPLAIDNIRINGTMDAIPPILCPAEYTYNFSANCTAVLPDLTESISMDSYCPAFLTFTQSPAMGTVVTTSSTVTITATDHLSQTSTCSFTAIAADIVGPTLMCPLAPIVLSSTANCQAILGDQTTLVHILDNCSLTEDLELVWSIPFGTVITDPSTQISLIAYDEAGNQSACGYTVQLLDNTPPTLVNCPTAITAYRGTNCEAITPNVINNVLVEDNCSDNTNILITQHPVINSAIGNFTSITIYAEDNIGNIGSCVVQLFVVDTIRPVVNCSSTVEVPLINDCSFVMPDLTEMVPYTDNCTSTNFQFSQSVAAGTLSSNLTTVLISVTDESLNTASCMVNVIPIDLIAPTITCPSTQNILPNLDCEAVLSSYVTQSPVLDNCSNFTITQSPAEGTILPAGTHTLTMTVFDLGNNEASCTFQLNILDNLPATLECPTDIAQCTPIVTFASPSIEGTCDGSVVELHTHGLSSGMEFPIGTTLMNYTVEGASTSPTCSFTITVLDDNNVANVITDSIFLCNSNSTALQATFSSEGSWSSIGTNSAVIASPNEAITAINGLSNGIYQFVWTVNNSVCGITKDTAYVFNNLPAVVNIAQDQLYACNSNYQSIEVISNAPGRWSANNSTSFINETLFQTSAFNLQTGWNTLYFTASAIAGCPQAQDSIRIFKSGDISFPTLDSTYCFANNLDIVLPLVDMEGITSVNWPTSSLSVIETTEGYRISNLKLGLNETTMTLKYEHCPSRVQEIEINVKSCGDLVDDELLTNLITPNGDGKNDEFTLNGLDEIYPSLELYIHDRWGSLVFEGTGKGLYWNATTMNGEKVPVAAYYYTLRLNDSTNKIMKGSITVIY